MRRVNLKVSAMSCTIAVIDFGYCNIGSITRALDELGANVVPTRDAKAVAAADKIVLPGVGAFSAAMGSLRSLDLVDILGESVTDREKPFLGICLGMQLMADYGLEGGQQCAGLGLVPGAVEKMIPTDESERIPHMGWNNVTYQRPTSLFTDIPEGADFYFVHSFHLRAEQSDNVIGITPFAGGITAAVQGCHDQAFGVQFHPEKSQKFGMKLLRNFVDG
jgi:glutamine amidotransferase